MTKSEQIHLNSWRFRVLQPETDASPVHARELFAQTPEVRVPRRLASAPRDLHRQHDPALPAK